MKSIFRHKGTRGVFAGLLLAAVFPSIFLAAEAGLEGSFALILINTDNLACSPCLESLKTICRALPPDVQEKRIIGILTYRDGDKPDPRRGRIARTRWTGYSRANGILFPVCVDTAHVFNGLSEEGPTILLFDEAAGCIRRWNTAFHPDTLRELAGFLSDGKPDKMGKKP